MESSTLRQQEEGRVSKSNLVEQAKLAAKARGSVPPPDNVLQELVDVVENNDTPGSAKVDTRAVLQALGAHIPNSQRLNHICRKYLGRKGFWAP